jgi:NAD(P)-dependent dehydrogenase (short-subunit alcohol dehydrogenase family)
MKLKDKFALITGASTGIGRAIAIELAREGGDVALVARNKSRLFKTKRLVEQAGGRARIYSTDLCKLDEINSLIDTIKNDTPKVDVIANVAAIWHGTKEVYAGRDYESFPQKVIFDTFMVGTIAPALLIHGLLPLMSKGSRIINLSGTFENGAKGWLPYFVSKRAIEDLTVGLAQELKDKGIRVYGISPSDTATEAYRKFFPEYLSDAVDPQEIAKFAVLLCSSETDKISGTTFVVKKGKEPYPGYHS